MKTTVVFIPFNVMLLLHNSNSFSLNVAKTLLLSAWLDSSTALNTPFTIPDNVLTMHPVFIPKRAEISKLSKINFSMISIVSLIRIFVFFWMMTKIC